MCENKMASPITYKFTQKGSKLMFKTPSRTGWSYVLSKKGRPSSAFSAVVRNGAKIHPTVSKSWIFNDLTQRWKKASTVFDQRTSRPQLKGSWNNKHAFGFENGRVGFRKYTHLKFLPEMVKAYMKARNYDLRDAFSMELNSGTISGATMDLHWFNYYAFVNWWKGIFKENRTSNSGDAYREFVDAYEQRGKQNPFLLLKDVAGSINLGGGCHRQRGAEPRLRFTKRSVLYDFHIYNPISLRNNCGLEVLRSFANIDFGSQTNLQLRKEFGLKSNAPISPATLTDIYAAYTTANEMPHFVDYRWDGVYNSQLDYILYVDGHYMKVESMTRIGKQADKIRKLEKQLECCRDEGVRAKVEKMIKGLRATANRTMLNCKRGLLTYDFETRNDLSETAKRRVGLFDDGSVRYGEVLTDVVCCVTYRPLRRKKNEEMLHKIFITDGKKTSARKFLDFLRDEHLKNRHYNCLAHNGSNFDSYLVLKEYTKAEMLNNPVPHFRGLSILGMYYFGCVFRDTGCYLTGSLKKLCKDFKVDKEHEKLDTFKLNDGRTLKDYQICFYKPQLDVRQFLRLQHTEKDFWEQYVTYCMHDTLSLFIVWEKFRLAYEKIITELADHDDKYARHLLAKCGLLQSPTISSVNQRILEELNREDAFGSVQLIKAFYKTKGGVDQDKYNFLLKFKRGGVSHTHQPGKHTYPIMGVDICSQYPWAMTKMKVPCGKSWWESTYDDSKYGFYHLTDMKFGKNTEDLKPVCAVVPKGKGSLNWRSGHHIAECYVDSEMIRYLFEHYDLLSFKVEKALVSYQFIDGHTVFSEYIGRLFKAKQRQDIYKQTGNPEYNPSMRKATKDSINSLSGKLLANPQIYFSLKYCVNPEVDGQRINGVNYRKDKKDFKTNHWLTCGLMMYSYSKFLLFDYVRCLPKKGDSVIQIETDGIYAAHRDYAEFRHNLQHYDGRFADSMKLGGKNLGNLVLEHISTGDAYFLGKKKYSFYCKLESEDVMRMLGVPKHSYEVDGTKKVLVTPQVYETVFNGKDVVLEFMQIRKTMENMPELVGFMQKRTIYANRILYKTYE